MGKNSQQAPTSIGREFSSGGLVYKKENGDVLWLIAASAPSKLFPDVVWRLPKGWIDDNKTNDLPGPIASGIKRADEQSLENAALREVKEEGGINAKVVKKIGTNKFIYTHPARGRILKFVTMYLMEYLSNTKEGYDGETSEVAWLPYEKAYEKLTFDREKDVLKKGRDLLASLA